MAQICIMFHPGELNDMEEVMVPHKGINLFFKRGVAKMVPDDLGADLLKTSGHKFKPAEMPAQAGPAATQPADEGAQHVD